jgi:DNA polymerase-1
LLHCTFNQVNTVTGRLSASYPNLQNIPITTEVGRRVRQAFVSRYAQRGGEGYLISADYSQVELRILAHLANDAALIAAFARDEDIHARTAATVFGVPIAEVTTEQRGHAKKTTLVLRMAWERHLSQPALACPSTKPKPLFAATSAHSQQ